MKTNEEMRNEPPTQKETVDKRKAAEAPRSNKMPRVERDAKRKEGNEEAVEEPNRKTQKRGEETTVESEDSDIIMALKRASERIEEDLMEMYSPPRVTEEGKNGD